MKDGQASLHSNTETATLKQLRKQATRCRQWADRICVQCRGKLTLQQDIAFAELNKRDALAIKADLTCKPLIRTIT